MVRAWGRQPRLAAGGFQGYSLFVRSLRLAVRTSPSHGENRSSILLGSASLFKGLAFQNRLQTGFWEGLGENPWASTSVHSLKISIHFHLSVKQSLGDLAGLRSPKGSVRTLCGPNANPKCWDSSKHDRFDNFTKERRSGGLRASRRICARRNNRRQQASISRAVAVCAILLSGQSKSVAKPETFKSGNRGIHSHLNQGPRYRQMLD